MESRVGGRIFPLIFNAFLFDLSRLSSFSTLEVSGLDSELIVSLLLYRRALSLSE